MEQNQPENRHASDKDFIQSLNQLQDVLQVGETEDEEGKKRSNDNLGDDLIAEDSLKIDMAAFEDAVNDIEQYMDKQTGE
ncbi:MAG: hypothetical protein PUP91_30085 [Rhizonema sp. PD37]|nr:hypothetical protein [Rhizonema sp. PD37]